jgi:hypothetical protein
MMDLMFGIKDLTKRTIDPLSRLATPAAFCSNWWASNEKGCLPCFKTFYPKKNMPPQGAFASGQCSANAHCVPGLPLSVWAGKSITGAQRLRLG